MRPREALGLAVALVAAVQLVAGVILALEAGFGVLAVVYIGTVVLEGALLAGRWAADRTLQAAKEDSILHRPSPID